MFQDGSLYILASFRIRLYFSSSVVKRTTAENRVQIASGHAKARREKSYPRLRLLG